MSYGGRECRDCEAPIAFIQRKGRWIPVTPGTEERHRCQIDQVCEGCQKTFKGPNWMKVCADCYRSGRSAQNPAQTASQPAHEPEALRPGGYDDDVPPF